MADSKKNVNDLSVDMYVKDLMADSPSMNKLGEKAAKTMVTSIMSHDPAYAEEVKNYIKKPGRHK